MEPVTAITAHTENIAIIVLSVVQALNVGAIITLWRTLRSDNKQWLKERDQWRQDITAFTTTLEAAIQMMRRDTEV